MKQLNSAEDALKTLIASSGKKTQAARFRELLPTIEQAQAAGISHRQIIDTLNQHEFNLTLSTYSSMLHRERKRNKLNKPEPSTTPSEEFDWNKLKQNKPEW